MLTVPLLPRPSDVFHPLLVSGWQRVPRVRWCAAVLRVRRARERICALPQVIRLNITNANSSLKRFFFFFLIIPIIPAEEHYNKEKPRYLSWDSLSALHCMHISPLPPSAPYKDTYFCICLFFKPTFPPVLRYHYSTSKCIIINERSNIKQNFFCQCSKLLSLIIHFVNYTQMSLFSKISNQIFCYCVIVHLKKCAFTALTVPYFQNSLF